MATREQLTPVTIAANQDGHQLQARVTPGFGANLVSLTVDGTEFIHYDEEALLAGQSFTGAFNMFPTPCRLDGCSYVYEGRRISQQKHGEPVFIHGLVRDESFAFQAEPDRVTSWIDITPTHPVYAGFPFACRLTLTHAIEADGLRVSFSVENRDAGRLPFGYGIHPFWRLHGTRDQVRVRVPCERTLELAQLVPTGGSVPVVGTPLDLRAGPSLAGLFVDNVYWPRQPGADAEVAFAALGKRLIISASEAFAHMIVYAPEGQPFVCVENLTTCPNAPNLVPAGHGEMAHMLVAEPGERVEGWVRYCIVSPAA